MKLKLVVLAAFALSAGCTRDGDSSAKSVSEAVSMQQREDGKFDVVCKDQSHETVTAEQIQANEICKTSTGTPTSELTIANFIVDQKMVVSVPEGMHVQQYSSDASVSGSLRFYRISPESDPNAIGSDACIGSWDRRLSAKSPLGKVYDYCSSTISSTMQGWQLEGRFAANHLQIATDADIIATNPDSHEVILYNKFGKVGESFQSRFASLCQNGIGGFQGLNPVRRSDYPLTVAKGFFSVESKYSPLWTCDVILAGTGSSWGEPQLWKVGAVFIVGQNQAFPDLSCATCNYSGSSSLLEVVYMSRHTTPDAIFAKQVQQTLLKTLSQVAPQ